MSKGSNRRPAQVPDKQIDANWKLAFGKKKNEKKKLDKKTKQ
jgi:hypothetical protein